MTTPGLPFNFDDMAKAYDPQGFEVPIYEWWEKSGYFKPEVADEDAEPFVIAIPPPNVTGELHLGHVMFVALEDLMISLSSHAWQSRLVDSRHGSCWYCYPASG